MVLGAPLAAIGYVLVAAFGALILYVKLLNENQPVMGFITRFHAAWETSLMARFIDVILFVSVGAIAAVILTQPTNVQQALMAGFGWTGLFSVASRRGAT